MKKNRVTHNHSFSMDNIDYINDYNDNIVLRRTSSFNQTINNTYIDTENTIECSICLDNIDNNNCNNTLFLECCNNYVHYYCIINWCKSNCDSKYNNLCILCRKDNKMIQDISINYVKKKYTYPINNIKNESIRFCILISCFIFIFLSVFILGM